MGGFGVEDAWLFHGKGLDSPEGTLALLVCSEFWVSESEPVFLQDLCFSEPPKQGTNNEQTKPKQNKHQTKTPKHGAN